MLLELKEALKLKLIVFTELHYTDNLICLKNLLLKRIIIS